VPSTTSRIEAYLRQVWRELPDGVGRGPGSRPERLTVVQGSSAADPDSLVGSTAYAFLLHEEQSAAAEDAAGRARWNLIVPRMTIRKEELRLRPVVLALFRRAGVSPETLIDREALEPSSWPEERLRVVLVDTDGRELSRALRRQVVEILDHHEPRGGRLSVKREIIAPVGSACTLVTEQILSRRLDLLDRPLAVLLLGPVLLDTVNLDRAAGRATDRDTRAAARLREIAGAAAEGLYEELQEARTRLEGLSAEDLLRRDYKSGEAGGLRYGLASVPLPAVAWARRGDPRAGLRETAARERLDILAVLFAYDAGDRRSAGGKPQGESFRRELLLWVRGASLYAELIRYLEGLSIGLRALPEPRVGALQGASAWTGGLFGQGDSGFSRKRLEPALRRFLESGSQEAE
jgi:exopolyphosphatase